MKATAVADTAMKATATAVGFWRVGFGTLKALFVRLPLRER